MSTLGALQTSQWQWTASVFTTWYHAGSCCRLFTEDCCPVLLKTDKPLSLVHTLFCCRTLVLHKLGQVYCNWNVGKDAKCLTAYIVQRDTGRVCPAVNWVIRGIRKGFRENWKIIINLYNSTAHHIYCQLYSQYCWFVSQTTIYINLHTLNEVSVSAACNRDFNDIFVNCNWVGNRWQKYSTHLHTDNT